MRVEDMSFMFRKASKIRDPNVTNFDMRNVRSIRHMFAFATLAQPDTSKWIITSKLSQLDRAFWAASAANPNVTNW